MISAADADTEKKLLMILKVLSESYEPLGSTAIARKLEERGLSLSERTVRYHLKIADERGYTRPMGRDGRMITERGMEELREALAPEQLGFIQDKLELLAFNTTFDPKTRSGLLPINTSLFDKKVFPDAVRAMRDAFKAGLCVSQLVAVAREGQKLGDVVIPDGKVGLATVCSVIVNGVLLKHGVPVDSRFGGVLEIKNSKPKRFVAIINYGGTSLDPSEQYIRARMTSVCQAATIGNGKILANFRELPAPARPIVEQVVAELKEAGMDGVYALGNTSEPVCQISVGTNRIGMALLGGLNPVAAAVESGIEVENAAESGLLSYQELISYRELPTIL
jgi:repressor of nif and glnA expression